jgi:hypothetical protein
MNAEEIDARKATVWISSVNVLAGIWLIIAPFVLLYEHGTARINDIVVGIVIAVFALVRSLAPGLRTAWLSWLNALWGIWLIIGSFILGYGGAARTNDVILGIIVLVFGLWREVETDQRPTTMGH